MSVVYKQRSEEGRIKEKNYTRVTNLPLQQIGEQDLLVTLQAALRFTNKVTCI